MVAAVTNLPDAPRANGWTVASLRSACELLVRSRERVRATSVTVALTGTHGEALALLRRTERLAAEFGLRHRVELHHRAATVHLWRERRD